MVVFTFGTKIINTLNLNKPKSQHICKGCQKRISLTVDIDPVCSLLFIEVTIAKMTPIAVINNAIACIAILLSVMMHFC